MARKTSGARYPHATTDAREHDHTMCPVIAAIARKATAGEEPWGTRHVFPVTSQTEAAACKKQFYAAKYCRRLEREFGEKMSVQTGWEQDGAGKYSVWVRAWPRSAAKAEIARRVKAGEQLAYNVMRGA